MRTIALIIATLISGAALAQQPGKVTKKYFPDPQVEIATPAFTKKHPRVTSYKQMMRFLEQLVAANPSIMTMEVIGQTQRGKAIPAVYVSKGQSEGKVKVLYSARVHGDEPASTEGMLYLLERMANDSQMQQLLDRIELVVVPMVNIDGGERLNRASANGIDLNRDMSKLMAPESRALRAIFNRFNPDVAIDFHEFLALRADFATLDKNSYNLSNPFDAMFLYSGNLNVAPAIRDITKSLFVAQAQKDFTRAGYTFHDYYTTDKAFGSVTFNVGGSSARSTSNAFSLSNSISILMEIRGVRMGNTSLKRRVHTTYTVAQSYLQTAYSHADRVKAAIAEANASEHEVVVKASPKKVEGYVLPFIDLERNTTKELAVSASLNLEATPTLVRQRPEAYYIAPTEKLAAEKLQQLGIEVDTLTAPRTVDVEAYRVERISEAGRSTDGIRTLSVATTVSRKSVTLPAGSFKVSMQQRRASMAAAMLEPEAPNGFVFFRIVEPALNAELPVYRFTK